MLRTASPAAALLCLLAAVSTAASAEAGGMEVDAAIVFAVDNSSSIHAAEADLQRHGHAEALRSSEVAQAIAHGATGCIAIAYVEWSMPGWLRTVLPWTKICSREDGRDAAAEILSRSDNGVERRGRRGTAISHALEVGSLLLDRFPGSADRKIIDISANGTNNGDRPVARARDRVVAKGHVINAIVLARTEPGVTDDLPGYFRDSVIGGSGAFVVVPDRPADYAGALRRKLVIEISDAGMNTLPPAMRPGFTLHGADGTAGRGMTR